jgi:hypothetical protein
MKPGKDIEEACVRYYMIRPVLIVAVLAVLLTGTELLSEHLSGRFPLVALPLLFALGVLINRFRKRC